MTREQMINEAVHRVKAATGPQPIFDRTGKVVGRSMVGVPLYGREDYWQAWARYYEPAILDEFRKIAAT